MKDFFENTKLVYILLFFLAFSFSLFLQLQTANIPGIDGHFYIKMAQMVREKGGLFHEFPWLHFTPFRDNFYGLHWLYYLLLVPFTLVGDLILGAKLATAVFFALIVVSFYFLTRSLGFKYSWLGVLLLLGLSSSFLYRVHMGRPITLSVVFLLLGLYAILKKRYIFLFFVSFFYVWAYDGYIVLTFLCGLWFFVYFVKERKFDLRPLLANIAGIVWGSFLNPYFPEVVLNSHLSHNPLVYQLITEVSPSAEWAGREFFSNFFDNWLLIISFLAAYIIGFITFFLRDFREKKEDYLFNAYLWGSILLFFFLTTLANRFIEYAVPLLGFYLLFILSRVVPYFYKKARGNLKVFFEGINKSRLELLKWFSFLALICLFILSITQNSRALIDLSTRTEKSRLQEASRWLKENTKEGGVVYNAAWEDFPFLFFHNAHNYYVVGLDAYYLYLFNQDLYFLHHNLADRGKPCPKVGCNLACDLDQDKKVRSVVKNKFESDYIVIDKDSGGESRKRMDEFVRILKNSSDFKKVFQDSQFETVYIFKVLKNK